MDQETDPPGECILVKVSFVALNVQNEKQLLVLVFILSLAR